MFLYSIACGLTVAGAFIAFICVIGIMSTTQIAGFAANFQFGNYVLPLFVSAAYAIGCVAYGLTTAIGLGHQLPDYFILIVTFIVAIVVGVLLAAIARSIENRLWPRWSEWETRRYVQKWNARNARNAARSDEEAS